MTRLRIWRDWLWVVAPVALIYAAHLWYGADNAPAALAMATAEGLLALLFCMKTRFLTDIAQLRGIIPIATIFGAVVLVAIWSMSPWGPGGGHPVWSYVDGPAALSMNRSSVQIEIFKLGGLACLFLIGGGLGLDFKGAQRAVMLLVWAGGMFSFIAVIMLLSGAQIRAAPRLAGPFDTANSAGTVFAMLFVLALPCVGRAEQSVEPVNPANELERRFISLAPPYSLLMFLLVCIILTASRGAMIAVGVATFAFLVMEMTAGRLKPAKAALGALMVALAGLGALAFKGTLAVERFGQITAGSVGRKSLVLVHWKAFLESPLFGYGVGAFPQINALNLNESNFELLWRSHSLHNVYLQWLEEGGLLGAIPMFVCIATIITWTVLGLKTRRRQTSWVRAMLAADVVVLVHGMSDFALQEPSIAAFWALILGLQLGMVSRR